MKRDMELVRRVLLRIEELGQDSQNVVGWVGLVEDGYEPEAIQYHLQILHDAGLIRADELVPGQWWPERMTWAGHEFLDAARNDAIWEKAKKRIEETTGAASFEVLYQVLLRLQREAVEAGRARPRSSTSRKRRG